MSPRQVILPSVFASIKAKPFESLERWMLAKVEVWEVPDRPTDFETYVGLKREEVEEEICSVWMLLFRSKEALNNALCVLIDGYDGGVLADFCRYYSKLLSEMEIEVKR